MPSSRGGKGNAGLRLNTTRPTTVLRERSMTSIWKRMVERCRVNANEVERDEESPIYDIYILKARIVTREKQEQCLVLGDPIFHGLAFSNKRDRSYARDIDREIIIRFSVGLASTSRRKSYRKMQSCNREAILPRRSRALKAFQQYSYKSYC